MTIVLTVSSHVDRRPCHLSVGQGGRCEYHGAKPYRPTYRTHFTNGLDSCHFSLSFQSVLRLDIIFPDMLSLLRFPFVPFFRTFLFLHSFPSRPSAGAHNNTSRPLNIYAIERDSRYGRHFIPSRLIAGIFISLRRNRSTDGSSKEIIRIRCRVISTRIIFIRDSIEGGISLKQVCINRSEGSTDGLSRNEDSTAILIWRIQVKEILRLRRWLNGTNEAFLYGSWVINLMRILSYGRSTTVQHNRLARQRN